MSFADEAAPIAEIVDPATRARIVEECARAKSPDRAIRRLRDALRAHRFDTREGPVLLDRWVRRLDQRARQDGFHVLNDWDGRADRFCENTIPADLAEWALAAAVDVDRNGDAAAPQHRHALAALLDYGVIYLIALLAMRSWDDGDPNANLDHVSALLDRVQSTGAELQVASDAATLILLATSHFEPDLSAYERLRLKVRGLDPGHRLAVAVTHAAILGGHLRFGLEVTCAGDLQALRDDNTPDYPWLADALAVLLQAFDDEGSGGASHARIAEAVLVGLSADPRAFLAADAPEALRPAADSRQAVARLLSKHRETLLAAVAAEQVAIKASRFSAFAFSFNFPHNLVKGIVADSVVRGVRWPGLGDLLTSHPFETERDATRRDLAKTLHAYAERSPDIVRGRPEPAIRYSPEDALRVLGRALRVLLDNQS